MAEYKTSWPWFLLATVIPFLGPIIVYLVKKDTDTAMAEVAKWLLLAQILVLIPYVGWILWIGLLLWRYSEDKTVYKPWYLFFSIPLIGYIIAMVQDNPPEVKKDMTILFIVNIVLAVVAWAVAGSALWNTVSSVYNISTIGAGA